MRLLRLKSDNNLTDSRKINQFLKLVKRAKLTQTCAYRLSPITGYRLYRTGLML
jgi:hypothetical protein